MATGEASDSRVGAVALLWGREDTGPRRGPRPTLSLDAIARAGIEIADAEGLSAVTMQRVAAALGVTKMALYRYVPGKVELVALMTEEGIGEAPESGGAEGDGEAGDGEAEGWRPRLDAWARAMYERFARHPWALEATVGARPIGPNEFGWLEGAVAALTGTGLGGGEMLDVAATLAGHARACALQSAAANGGRPERDMHAAFGALLKGREERFPAIKAAFDSAVAHGAQDNALDFGLARILDGVELLVERRAGE